MRLKYYLITLRQMKIKKSFVLFFIILITTMLICICIFNKNIEPVLKALCEENARSIALKSSNMAVRESIEGIKYEDLMTVQKDYNGKINALTANVMIMNTISNKVTTRTEEEINKNKESNITIPIGSFVGSKLLGGYGKEIDIKTIPVGSVKAEFKSTFESSGINQTKHKISIEIITEIKVIAPFYIDTQEYINSIIIAETVIVGDTPSTYFDMQGIENITEKIN